MSYQHLFRADSNKDAATSEQIDDAERALGLLLPGGYKALLREANGGELNSEWIRVPYKTSWWDGYVNVSRINGVGPEHGSIDDPAHGGPYMIKEWDLPEIGIYIAATPASGEDCLMLDYRQCGPKGEPSVVYIDEDRNILPVADTFKDFISKLQKEGPPL